MIYPLFLFEQSQTIEKSLSSLRVSQFPVFGEMIFGPEKRLPVLRRLANVLQLDPAHFGAEFGPELLGNRRYFRRLRSHRTRQPVSVSVDAPNCAEDHLLKLSEIDFRRFRSSGTERRHEVESAAANLNLDGVTKLFQALKQKL